MNKMLVAYLLLERLAMEADDDGEDEYAEIIRGRLDGFWPHLSVSDGIKLQMREGETIDELNPTKIVVVDDVISAVLKEIP